MEFNKQQHLACPKYHKNVKTLFELIENQANDVVEKTTKSIMFAIILEGEADLFCGAEERQKLTKNDMFLIPQNIRFSLCFRDKSKVIMFYLQSKTEFCLHLKHLLSKKTCKHYEMSPLKANELIINTINYFLEVRKIGVECSEFIYSTINQLVILIASLYPEETMSNFFAPVISNDIQFEMSVLAHKNKVFKVNEFSLKIGLGLDTFRSRFEKVFGMTPQQWIKEERKKLIVNELVTGKSTFKEIANLAGFNAAHEFSRFCKQNFGKVPSLMCKAEDVN